MSLEAYKTASIDAIKLITDLLYPSQRKEIELLMAQGLCLKLSTIIGEQPDVQLSIVNDLGDETLLYSLINQVEATLQ